MLALRRLRCLLHSVPVSQTRTLNTRPRPLPIYISSWDPTLHDPLRPSTAPIVLNELLPHDGPRQTTFKQSPPVDVEDGLPPSSYETNHDERFFNGLQSRIAHTTRAFKKFQYLLDLANSSDNLEQFMRAPLWRAYTRAKSYKSSLPHYLTSKAWNILWRSQYMDFTNVSRRQVRLDWLDRDMIKAQAPPVAGQAAHHIERTFLAGMEETALDTWAAGQAKFATASEFLDTGVRLFALAGHVDQARKIMDDLLQLEPTWDTSVMMAMFRAYTSSGSEHHIERARELYSAIRERLGTEATLELHDSCMVGFLEARSLQDAKQVFRDIVCGGFLETMEFGLQAIGVTRRLNLLYALGTDISAMSSIALDAIAVLPVAYHGHVFSDWMKSAMVGKAPEAAAQILDLMMQRGYQPETEHFEYLLRTLFRTKDPENVAKAETIGWKMIEEARLSSIPADGHPSGGRVMAITEKLRNGSLLDADPAAACVPAANASTFALIMRHHASKSQWEHVDYLTRQLRLANVQANASILDVLIENQAEKGDFVKAWQIYKSLTDESTQAVAVFPTGQTIRILWRTIRLMLSDPDNREDPDLPTPRELLGETLEWWALVRQRPDADRFLQGLAADNYGAIAKLILHSFSFKQDLPGALVALHILHKKLGIHTIRDDVMIVLQQQAWKDMRTTTRVVRRRLTLGIPYAKSMKRLTALYERLLAFRLRRLKITEDMLRNYTPDQISDLELNMISEVVRVVLLAHGNPADYVELLIQGAAIGCGVPGLETGDVNAFEMVFALDEPPF